MPSDISDRLEKIVDAFTDGNKSKFSRLLNMTPQTFNNYVQGNRKPGWDVMRRFLAVGVNLNYLVAGIPPIKTIDINEANISTVEMANDVGENYFSEIGQENLNPAEHDLLAEVKQFSNFLENRSLNPHVKRLLLELLIQSIDQAIEQPQRDPTPSDDD